MANDAIIIGVISFIFILLGTIIPLLQADLGAEQTISDVDGLQSELQSGKSTSIGAIKILGSIAKMFFWTFGQVPLIADLFLLSLRIILIFTVVRNIHIGGGA